MNTFSIRLTTCFSAVMVVLATCYPVLAAVHVVPPSTPDHQAATPYDTWENAATNIQTAVTYAGNNALTEVWVLSGWYLLPGPVTVNKGITLRSYKEEDGQIDPENTVIDGKGAYQGFSLTHENAVLDGFTVTNCNTLSFGSAVYINEDAIVRNCTFAFNKVTSPTSTTGGTIYMRGGRVENCNFQENWVRNAGGGIIMGTGTMLVTNCTFNGNHAAVSGGGVTVMGGSGQIVDCVFSNNFSERGGGYYASGGTSLVERCVFNGNIATNDGTSGASVRGGGGLQIGSKATVSLRNCLIVGNQGMNTKGGGIFLHTVTNSWVENCTIVSNYSKEAGGGVAITASDRSVVMRNNIIYDNWYDSSAASSNVAANAVNLSWTNNCVGTTLKLNDYGAGNLLQVDPKFVDSAANDWHLLQNSPCVDSGDTLDWMWTAIDFDGERRVRNGVVDRGCYESAYHLGTTLIVK